MANLAIAGEVPGAAGQAPRGVARRALACFRPYRAQVALVVLLTIVMVVAQTGSPVLVKYFIDTLLQDRNVQQLYLWAGLMVALPIVAGVLSLWQAYLGLKIGTGVMHDLRRALFENLQRLPLRFFTATRAGEIQSRLGADINGLQEHVSNALNNVTAGVLGLVVTLGAMFYLEWRLTVATLVIIPVLALISLKLGSAVRRATEQTHQTMADLTASSQEWLSVNGVLLSKTFAQHGRLLQLFSQISLLLAGRQARQSLLMVGNNAFLGSVFGVAPMVVFLWAIPALATAEGVVTFGTVVAFTQLQTRFFFRVMEIFREQLAVLSAFGLFERVFEYLDLRPSIVDAQDAAAIQPSALVGQVSVRDVSFRYPGEEGKEPAAGEQQFALRDVSFSVEPGQLLAIVGPSGSGKTTIAYLLSRLYEADRGQVEIGGVDVRRVRLEALAEVVGVVSQETFLFHASVLDNLRFGKPSATREEIEAAARAAFIHDRILALPEGYDSIVGERGFKLSGGEKQRIGIARVLLRNPRVLVLDEATSALDSVSEREVQAALDRLMEGRTTIAIAHRLSTVLRANRILVLDRGAIVEQGTHAELLRRGGLYARLHAEQTGPGAAGQAPVSGALAG